jgi:Mn2+/Fe2+ NRAMP family transporter
MVIIANDVKIMGELTNTKLTRVFAGLGLLLLLGLAVEGARNLFF